MQKCDFRFHGRVGRKDAREGLTLTPPPRESAALNKLPTNLFGQYLCFHSKEDQKVKYAVGPHILPVRTARS